jgi:hypothetical protein
MLIGFHFHHGGKSPSLFSVQYPLIIKAQSVTFIEKEGSKILAKFRKEINC